MPQWDYPHSPPYSIYQCERPYDQAPQLIKCKLRQPLKGPNHIRLLKLYPPGWPDRLPERVTREDDSDIQCDIYQVGLADVTTKKRPYFATLSYSCGTHDANQTIRCGKESVKVTLSLYEALVYVRNLKTPRLLWVDSLCINQSDEQEKGRQVQRMHLIYGQSHCISWLGIESEDKDDLYSMLPLMRWLSHTSETFFKQRFRITWEAVNDCLQQQPALGFATLRQIPWATLYRCMDRQVFKRLWCVQEILIARSNDIQTSKSHVDIAVLARSATTIKMVLEDLTFTLPGENDMLDETGCTWETIQKFCWFCRNLANMLLPEQLPCLEFKKYGPDKHTTAFNVAAQHYWKECSDPRDHVYGLAALCGLGESYRISYTAAALSVQDVFIDFTLHCVHTTKSLESFRSGHRNTIVRRGSRVHTDLAHRMWTIGLPSWCADFAGPKPVIRILTNRNTAGYSPYETCRRRPACLKPLARRKLGVTGMQVGVIRACSSIWRGTSPGETEIDYSGYEWAHIASVQNCISSAATLVPEKSLWKMYLDVRSTGVAWQHAPPWSRIAHVFPAKTRDRMVRSSIGAAWIMTHLPVLASKAELSPNRKLSPRTWSTVAYDVYDWIYPMNYGTRLFSTDNAQAILGTGPEGLCVGDIITVLFGGDVPFILRPDRNGHYILIGECYVSGIMQGQALDMGLEEREFVLV